ncbi:hypothetical protein CPB83DRAFT_761210 [Crepidotus variabilis]|uniref:2OGFeDO JBP1/TET oxygenase domain-containing protein n=1 Tax=Crepidotus variabilis TaxID=179855 RepID=A0A9P6JS82_9AGAR|nr:hypothetical protein CPB83DRAFT_761210 [Crepidotus variabilis]
MNEWSHSFNVVSIISNRQTPGHRDTGSALRWFNVLLAVRNYSNGHAEFSGLGLKVRYLPGTVVVDLGRVLRHSASCNGDRACIAYYMREKVWDALGPEKPGWAHNGATEK